MSELGKETPSQSDIDELLNPDALSGRQIEVLRKLDEKNLDKEDLEEILSAFMTTYQQAKEPSHG